MAIHIQSLRDLTAKRAAEIAIEQNEEAAMRYVGQTKLKGSNLQLNSK